MLDLQVRRSHERGYASHDWLQSYHSFSFAEYYDRNHMHYSALRVINDDVIAAGHGFGLHPHRDMEIITYMLQGQLQHQDSMGNGSVIKAGDVQCMSAGTGIMHSELNASVSDCVHLLQIWVMPERLNIAPCYAEKHFAAEHKLNRWCLIAAGDGSVGALKVHQDMKLYATLLDAGAHLAYVIAGGRSVYLHVASGDIEIDGRKFETGDAVMLDGGAELGIRSNAQSELLLFDLPLHRPLGARD